MPDPLWNPDTQTLARQQEREPRGIDPGRHGPDEQFAPMNLPPACRRFVEMVLSGRELINRSSSEKAATRLAIAILDDVPHLDNDALAGMCEFAVMAATWQQTMRTLLTQMRTLLTQEATP